MLVLYVAALEILAVKAETSIHPVCPPALSVHLPDTAWIVPNTSTLVMLKTIFVNLYAFSDLLLLDIYEYLFQTMTTDIGIFKGGAQKQHLLQK